MADSKVETIIGAERRFKLRYSAVRKRTKFEGMLPDSLEIKECFAKHVPNLGQSGKTSSKTTFF